MTKTHPESPEPTKGLAPATGPATGQPDINGWRLIESAPKDETDILICCADTGSCLVACWEEEPDREDFPWGTMDGPNYFKTWPTHWQPLPAPPESER